jgi:RNA polymerase sigma-B factor
MARERRRGEQEHRTEPVSGPPPPGPETQLADDMELFRLHNRTRDLGAREELIRRFTPLARSLALRYRGGSEPQDDLMQVASLGLLQAVDRFDPERGIPFAAFAAPTILGELRRHFRDRVWSMRVPRGLQERIQLVDEAVAKLTGELQRPPSVREVAERLDVDQVEVLEAFEASDARRTVSLDQPAGAAAEPDEASLADRIGSEDPAFDTVEQRAAISRGLPALSERELTVLRLRFVDDLTQSQIADRIGHSQMHVSRILRGALRTLRQQMETNPGEE